MAAEWLAILTLTVPMPGGGFATCTKSKVLSLEPGVTRTAVYGHMFGLFPAEFERANVLFFSVEPDRIGGEQ